MEEKKLNEAENPALQQGAVMLSGWQACPKCSGQGSVSKPPYLAGDINHWIDSVGQHECNVCKGKMIINIATGLPPDSH